MKIAKHSMRLAVTLVFLAVTIVAAWAHQDRIITLKDRELIGLPETYQPARLDLKANTLTIKDRELSFSPFLASLFQTSHELQITSSWYHQRSILPPYICFSIQPRGKDFGYKILVNLDTLDILNISVVVQESKTQTRELPVELDEKWKSSVRKIR